jgi:hypothetical protein
MIPIRWVLDCDMNSDCDSYRKLRGCTATHVRSIGSVGPATSVDWPTVTFVPRREGFAARWPGAGPSTATGRETWNLKLPRWARWSVYSIWGVVEFWSGRLPFLCLMDYGYLLYTVCHSTARDRLCMVLRCFWQDQILGRLGFVLLAAYSNAAADYMYMPVYLSIEERPCARPVCPSSSILRTEPETKRHVRTRDHRPVASGTVHAIVSNFLEHQENKKRWRENGFHVRVMMVSDNDFHSQGSQNIPHTYAHVPDPGSACRKGRIYSKFQTWINLHTCH